MMYRKNWWLPLLEVTILVVQWMDNDDSMMRLWVKTCTPGFPIINHYIPTIQLLMNLSPSNWLVKCLTQLAMLVDPGWWGRSHDGLGGSLSPASGLDRKATNAMLLKAWTAVLQGLMTGDQQHTKQLNHLPLEASDEKNPQPIMVVKNGFTGSCCGFLWGFLKS